VLNFRDDLINNVDCEYAAVHSFLSKLPQALPFEEIIRKSLSLFQKCSPDELQKRAIRLEKK
jgi:hypothetical protein